MPNKAGGRRPPENAGRAGHRPTRYVSRGNKNEKVDFVSIFIFYAIWVQSTTNSIKS